LSIFTDHHGLEDCLPKKTESNKLSAVYSEKLYQTIEHFWGYGSQRILLRMQVPYKEVVLSDDKTISLYDTSGIYFNNNYKLDIISMPVTRNYLDNNLSDIKPDHKTQRYYAKEGIITPEMAYVAAREDQKIKDLPDFKDWLNKKFNNKLENKIPYNITAEFVRDEIAQGRAIIPANKNHNTLEPMIIGRGFMVKLNVNLGFGNLYNNNSQNFSPEISPDFSPESLFDQIVFAAKSGADSVMIISDTSGFHKEEFADLVNKSPVPIGSAPICDALEMVDGDISKLNWDVYYQALTNHAEAGIDYIFVHANILLDNLEKNGPGFVLSKSRSASNGGKIMQDWTEYHQEENFLYANFDKLCDVLREYDISLVLSDAKRNNSVMDSRDNSFDIFGELTDLAWRNDVQVMVEGPGVMPMHMIHESMKALSNSCQDVPVCSFGASVTDIDPSTSGISSMIASAMMGFNGCSMLNYSPEKNHIKVSSEEEIKRAIMNYKIASHGADISNGNPNAWMRDYLISEAKYNLNWEDQFKLSLSHVTVCENGENMKNNKGLDAGSTEAFKIKDCYV